MKSAVLAVSLIASLVAAKGVDATPAEVNELSVKASGLTWKVNWGKAVMDGLKRLSGAKEVSQDDFADGVGTYIVTFDSLPKTKIAEIKKNLGKYKVEEVRLKFTSKVEGNKVGDLSLANPKDEDLLKEVSSMHGKKLVLSGTLSEDDKGNRVLTLSRVAEAK